MTPRASERHGVTLAELTVVIVILGVVAAVSSIAVATKVLVPAGDTRIARVAFVRAEAVRSGHAATLQLDVDGETYLVTAFPDGRVITDAPIAVDQLSGRAAHAAR